MDTETDIINQRNYGIIKIAYYNFMPFLLMIFFYFTNIIYIAKNMDNRKWVNANKIPIFKTF